MMDYTAMERKIEPVKKLLQVKQPQLALDRLLFLLNQRIFLPEEMWQVYQCLGDCYIDLMDIDKAQQSYWVALNHFEGMPLRQQQFIYSKYLFLLHYLPDVSRKFIRDQHFAYQQLCMQGGRMKQIARNVHGKIRVGYLAVEFIENVVSFFSIQLLTAYDASEFEVYVYSILPNEDILTDDLRKHVTVWRSFPVGTMVHQIASDIAQDEVDILFDLSVHTNGGMTLPVMAMHPALIQIAGIGYMSTSGLQAIDYFLTDIYLDPPGQHDEDFSEQLIRLPHSHLCYTPPERALQCRKKWELHQPIVFGSFNNFAKITDSMLLVWKEILSRVPGAKLLLKNASLYNWNQRKMAVRLRNLGFKQENVEIEGPTADYLDRYMDVDIILDTYPYTGGGSTCDALFRGVPVITKYGDRHGTRFSYSLLANIGIPELASETDGEYIAKAVALANDPVLLECLHEQIGETMKTTIMNSRQYVREVEAAYKKIWDDWLKEENR